MKVFKIVETTCLYGLGLDDDWLGKIRLALLEMVSKAFCLFSRNYPSTICKLDIIIDYSLATLMAHEVEQ